MPGQATSVEIPSRLLQHLEQGTWLAARLQETGRDSYILSGAAVTDPQALAQMDIPGHETCVEVGKSRESDANEVPASG